MRTALMIFILTPLLLSCVANGPSFSRMSDAEIARYNASVEWGQQVYCVREVRAGTHIKKRYCETLTEMHDRMMTSIQKLNTVNQGAPTTFTVY